MSSVKDLIGAITGRAFKLLQYFAPDEATKLHSLSEMIIAHFHGHRKIPTKELFIISASLVYVVSPLDIIPDVVPFFGYMDDAAILRWAYLSVKGQVKEFAIWREDNKEVNLWEKFQS